MLSRSSFHKIAPSTMPKLLISVPSLPPFRQLRFLTLSQIVLALVASIRIGHPLVIIWAADSVWLCHCLTHLNNIVRQTCPMLCQSAFAAARHIKRCASRASQTGIVEQTTMLERNEACHVAATADFKAQLSEAQARFRRGRSNCAFRQFVFSKQCSVLLKDHMYSQTS